MKIVRVHFRSLSTTTVSVESHLSKMITVFRKHGISVKMVTGKSLLLSEDQLKRFRRVDSDCTASVDEWSEIQRLDTNIPSTDIRVYFVQKLWDSTETPGAEAYLGCAAHIPGTPACVVASDANEYDTAHEVGHVMGLPHDNTKDNLMHPAQASYAKLPVLTASQIAIVKSSPLCH